MSGPPLAESRVEGRVLLIDAQERLLLLRVEDPAIDQPSLWITPGGGCEQGESPREAALRELYEEIGYRACELGPCVWRRKFRWRWGKRLIDSDSHYFLLRLNSVIEVSHAHASRLEREIFCEHRWWTTAELQAAAATQVFSPRGVPKLLSLLLKDNLPTAPIELAE